MTKDDRTPPQPPSSGDERWYDPIMSARPTEHERIAHAAWAEFGRTGDPTRLIELGLVDPSVKTDVGCRCD